MAGGDEPYLLSVKEAARFVGVGEKTLISLTRREHHALPYINIPNSKCIKFTRQLLVEYFDSLATNYSTQKNSLSTNYSTQKSSLSTNYSKKERK